MSTTTDAAPATSRSAAYRVLERIFDEGFAAGNDAIVDEICSPDLVEHQFGTAGQGAEAIAHVKAAIRDVHGAIPDISFTIEDSAESGDIIRSEEHTSELQSRRDLVCRLLLEK